MALIRSFVHRPGSVAGYRSEVECGYRIDLLVNDLVVVEVKSVDRLDKIFDAQLLTYLKLTGLKLGLLMNFNVAKLVDGIKRLVNGNLDT